MHMHNQYPLYSKITDIYIIMQSQQKYRMCSNHGNRYTLVAPGAMGLKLSSHSDNIIRKQNTG